MQSVILSRKMDPGATQHRPHKPGRIPLQVVAAVGLLRCKHQDLEIADELQEDRYRQ